MARSDPTDITAAVEGVGKTDSEKSILDQAEDLKKLWSDIYEHRQRLEDKLDKATSKKQKKAIQKQYDEVLEAAELSEDTLAAYKDILAQEQLEENLKRRKEIEKKVHEAQMTNGEKYAAQFGENLKEASKKAASAIGSALANAGDAVKEYLDIYSTYMSGIEARLQGRGGSYSFNNLNKIISQNSAISPYVKYTSVLENLSKLVDQGITDNITQRAFLMTISDKIATTFDAAEASLLEIVRIQQQDSTASRLGMEAELTKLFNGYFGDTSYLNSTYDAVQGALVDTSAALGTKAAVEFEYQVQKWLGSLGSVGVSSGTLSNIAQGINYLGTGDVDSLSGNAALQNLLVLASSRAGLDYNKMLTEGMNATEANILLGSIVSFVQELSQERNNVVRKQYAELFGLTSADMIAFQNISENTLKGLSKSAMTYNDTLTSLNAQLGEVDSRVHISEKINNVLENVLATTGSKIAGNTLSYLSYMALDKLQGITGGISIPAIMAFGSGIDLNTSVEQLGKTAIMGISLLGNLMSADFSSASGLNLDGWSGDLGGVEGYIGFQNAGQLTTRKSTTNYVASGSGTGIQQSVVDSGKKDAEEIQGTDTTGEDAQDKIIQVLEFLQEYFEGGGSLDSPLKVEIQRISSEASAGGTSPFYTYSGGTI